MLVILCTASIPARHNSFSGFVLDITTGKVARPMNAPYPQTHSRSGFLLEQWSRGLSEALGALESPQFDRIVFQAISRLVQIDFTVAFAYRGRVRPLILACTVEEPYRRVMLDDYVSGPYLLDPFFQAALSGTKSGCYRLASFAPDHFRQSEYYRKHYHRTQIGEEVGFFFELPDHVTGVLSVLRWRQHSPISRPEFSILQAIEPSLRAIVIKRWSDVSRQMDRPQRAEGERGFGNEFFDNLKSFGGSQLSLREHQIVSLILQGHSTESIARQLDLSPGTVKVHRRNVYRKLGISSQAELFAAFLESMRGREVERTGARVQTAG
jgi:DNA-binding CsgD family transcriptional regulator